MFSKQITKSEEFLEMPEGSQLLYFHLGMEADDDGIVQPAQVMRITGAKTDALKVLQAKGFLLALEGGRAMVITHWKINNWIQKDRYNPSIHRKLLEKSDVLVDEHNMYTSRIQDATHDGYTGKVSIGKVRLGKDEFVDVIDAPIEHEEPSDDMPLETAEATATDAAVLHKKFVSIYFKKAKGVGINNPTFTAGKDGALVKRILKNHDYEKTIEMLNRYFDEGEGKFCGYTIGGFYSCLNKLQLKRRERIKIADRFAGVDENGNAVREQARF
jgi:hypothetical protein